MGQVCRNCIASGQRRHLKKTSVFRKSNSLYFVFGFLEGIFWAVGRKNIGMVVKTENYPFIGIFWGQTFQQFPVFFRFLPENFRTSGYLIEANLSKVPCKCPEESFGEKNRIFFLHDELKNFGILARKSAVL